MTIWMVTQRIVDDKTINGSVRSFVADRRMHFSLDQAGQSATVKNVLDALGANGDDYSVKEAICKFIK